MKLLHKIDAAFYYFKRRWLYFFGAASIFASTCTFLMVWYAAFFNGYTIAVTVNSVGEAYLELILITCSIPVMAYLAIRWVKLMRVDIKFIRRNWSKQTGYPIPIDTL